MTFKTYLFADLDDSLFSAKHKLDEHQQLKPAALLKNGSPFSFMDEKHQAFLTTMRPFEIIPVTARNFDSFSRVQLPFNSFKIINFGAMILDQNNKLVNDWHQIIVPKVEQSKAELVNFFSYLESKTGIDQVSVRLINDYDLTLYLLIKSINHHALEILDELADDLAQYIDPKAFRIQRNGNNLTVVPIWLNKSYAVRYLKDMLQKQHTKILTIGMGDSHSDLAFMHQCDYALYPIKSQIRQFIELADSTTLGAR